ncbi:hypothetical protein Golax_007205 [Gossypium laxum]|uniref:Uncharacterized protein n=1 Tax=Gossypium laxum TaxID=34288 RepID=A0A7J9A676_9ROSI|nr:hypothetical protein [Gossypium laxum]
MGALDLSGYAILIVFIAWMQLPTTRAKSPKLGRSKSTTPLDSDGNSNSGHQLGRLSLDEKADPGSSAKVISPFRLKKPQRKSLPKLPSQKTSLSSTTNEENPSKALDPGSTVSKATTEGKIASVSSKVTEEKATLSNVTNGELSPSQQQETVSRADSGESQADTDRGPMVGEQGYVDLLWLFRVSLAKVAGLVVRIPAFLFESLYVNPPSPSCPPNFRKSWSLLLFEDP